MNNSSIATISKESIKQNIISTIAKKWNVSEKDALVSFDPLLMLLVDVVADEYYQIQHHWNGNYDDVLQHLIYSYKNGTNALPISINTGVFCAHPLDNSCMLKSATAMQTPSMTGGVIGNWSVLSDVVLYKIEGLKIESSRKELQGQQEQVNVIRLYARKAAVITSLNQLQVYFDIASFPEIELLLFALQHSEVTVNGSKANLLMLKDEATHNSESLESMIRYTYGAQLGVLQMEQTSELLSVIDNNEWITGDQVDFTERVIIEFTLPVLIQQSWLRYLNIVLNAFIGVNKQTHTIHHTIIPYLNVIPLPIDGQLLGVSSITGNQDQVYIHQQTSDQQVLPEGSYTLKTSSYSVSSSEAIKRNLMQLKDQINSSTAYFDLVKNDYLLQQFKEMQKVMYRMDDKLQNAKHLKSEVYYISLRPYKKDTRVLVHYETLDTHSPALMKVGQGFQIKGTLLEKDSLKLLTLPYAIRLDDTHKESVILSAYDVQLLCQDIFNEHFSEINISRNLMQANSNSAHKIVHICVEVVLQATYNYAFLLLDKSRLESAMKKRSIMSYPINFIFKIKE